MRRPGAPAAPLLPVIIDMTATSSGSTRNIVGSFARNIAPAKYQPLALGKARPGCYLPGPFP